MHAQRLKTLTLIHWSLMMPLVLFEGIVLYFNTSNPPVAAEDGGQFLYLPGGMLILLWPISMFLFQRLIGAIPSDARLDTKLIRFQSAHLVRMAMFEVIGMMAAVVSFITATNENLLIIAIVFGMFLTQQPTKVRLIQLLGLNAEEQVALDGE